MVRSFTMPSCKSHPVPAFYDTPEPQQPLPMLSSQMEMCYQSKNPVAVSAKEEMAISHLPIAAPIASGVMVKMWCVTTTKTTKSRATTPGAASTPRAASPITKPSGKSVVINEDGGERSDSPLPLESSLSSLDGDKESNKKIPKPIGEVVTIWRSRWAGERPASKNCG